VHVVPVPGVQQDSIAAVCRWATRGAWQAGGSILGMWQQETCVIYTWARHTWARLRGLRLQLHTAPHTSLWSLLGICVVLQLVMFSHTAHLFVYPLQVDDGVAGPQELQGGNTG
jgi:hypothetical protein